MGFKKLTLPELQPKPEPKPLEPKVTQPIIVAKVTEQLDPKLDPKWKKILMAGDPIYTTLSFAVVGTLAVGTNKAPTLLAPCTLTIVKVKLVVKTAPTGAAIIVDVNKNGTTIFTTQANRPQIAISATTGDSGTPDDTSLVESNKITIDIDQIGSTVAGANLTVEIVCTQAVAWA